MLLRKWCRVTSDDRDLVSGVVLLPMIAIFDRIADGAPFAAAFVPRKGLSLSPWETWWETWSRRARTGLLILRCEVTIARFGSNTIPKES